jgi:EAL domain-containing protein (putative c-di-GMP-specific phosphodiesterase class I)
MAVALEFLEPGEETNPETLEQLERLGTPLTLDDGGTAMVSLKVSPAP